MNDKIDAVKTSLVSHRCMTDFQARFHSPSDDDDIIPSKFYVEIRKTSWSNHVQLQLTQTSESGRWVFRPDSKLDYLLYSYLTAVLPSVRVKDDRRNRVQICWTKNPFHNMIEHGMLKLDGDLGPQIPQGWLDVHSQHFMKPGAGFRKKYNSMIGNEKCLTSWSTSLPKFSISSPQPWYFSESICNAMPLFL
jgi:hypothetical protein